MVHTIAWEILPAITSTEVIKALIVCWPYSAQSPQSSFHYTMFQELEVNCHSIIFYRFYTFSTVLVTD